MARAWLWWAVLGVACGGGASQERAASPHAGGHVRLLGEEECDALGAWIVGACRDRGNDRSSRNDGWCSDVMARTIPTDRSWVVECTRRVTSADEACFRGTEVVGTLIECDAAATKP